MTFTKAKPIIIPAKKLGAMALDDFCPRCFWLQHHCKAPWQIFPGIFSSIDAYTKNVVHNHINQYGAAPRWMPEYDLVHSWIKPPHWSQFKWQDPETGIVIRTVVDGLLRMRGTNDAVMIPDYKTSKYTDTQDRLLPMYIVQQNCSAIIWEKSFTGEVHSMPLIYCEPKTDMASVTTEAYDHDGFNMGFSAHVVQVERDYAQVFNLLHKAKDLLTGPLPEGAPGCKDCEKLEQIIFTVSNG